MDDSLKILIFSLSVLLLLSIFLFLARRRLGFAGLRRRYLKKVKSIYIPRDRFVKVENYGQLSKAKGKAEKRRNVVTSILNAYNELIDKPDYNYIVYSQIKILYQGTTNAGHIHDEQICVYNFCPKYSLNYLDLSHFKSKLNAAYKEKRWKGRISKRKYQDLYAETLNIYQNIVSECIQYVNQSASEMIELNHSELKLEQANAFSEFQWNYKKTDKNTINAERYISRQLREHILRRDSYTCCKCSLGFPQISKRSLHVDHVIPLARGGKSVLDNLQTLCANCNMDKSDDVDPSLLMAE